MTIRSAPPGAEVYVDDYLIGTTPVSTGYTFYGTRKIRLVKNGYETLTVYQPMPAPWYDVFGADFFSENLWPGKIRDERSFDYQMNPLVMVPTEELRSRAEQLRSASIMQAAAESPVIASPPGIAPSMPPAVGSPTLTPTPENLPPPANATPIGPLYPSTAGPQALPATSPPGNFGPPGNYPPPGGYGLPSNSIPGTYPVPNAYPAPSVAPSNGPLFNQPVVPPGWRPIGEAQTPLQR
ncbi:MAG TPA: PEGA domain-containing protein [Pirellulales bacterium]|nr:PEGA domain-containing protein [Pirellulales bacterium]